MRSRICGRGGYGVEECGWTEERWDGEAWDEGDEMGEIEGEEDTEEGEGGDPGAWGDCDADERYLVVYCEERIHGSDE